MLTRYVKGNTRLPLDLSMDEVQAIGRCLAHLHCALRSIGRLPGDSQYFVLPSAPEQRIRSLLEFHDHQKSASFYRRSLTYKLRMLDSFPEELQRSFPALPKQLLHGDFYAGNIVFDRANIPWVIDFDQCSVFHRAYEFMRAATFCCYVPSAQHMALPGIAEFARSYVSVEPLQRREADLMTDFYIWLLLAGSFAFRPDADPKMDYTSLRQFAEYRMHLTRWMVENRRDLQLLFREATV